MIEHGCPPLWGDRSVQTDKPWFIIVQRRPNGDSRDKDFGIWSMCCKLSNWCPCHYLIQDMLRLI